jgi:hypothetical protein
MLTDCGWQLKIEAPDMYTRGNKVGKKILNTANVYFPFLLHSVILNKSGNNFVLVYLSFHMFNITLKK